MASDNDQPRARFLSTLALWLCTGLALAAIEVAHLGASPAGYAAGALLLFAALLLSPLLSLAEPPLRALESRRPRLARATGLAALLLLGVSFAHAVLSGAGIARLLGGWHDVAVGLLGILLALSAMGGIWLLRRVFARRRQAGGGVRWAVGLALLVATLVMDLLNRRLYIGLYDAVHGAMALLTLVLAALTVAWFWQPGRWPTRVVFATCLAGILLGGMTMPELGRSRLMVGRIQREGVLSRRVLRVAWQLADRDGDGYSPVLGGGDCDDSRPDVHPGAREVPANGVDEDCLAGDAVALRSEPEPVPAPAPAPEPESAVGNWARQPGGGADGRRPQRPDLLLISVDALRPDFIHGFGHPRQNTPNIDVLIDQGVSFTQAYTSSPATGSTLPTLVTGKHFTNLYPAYRKVGTLPKTVAAAPSLLTELAQRGYHVVAAVDPPYRRFLQDKGVIWGTYRLQTLLPLAEERPQTPLALWLHQMDSHMAYTEALLAEFRQAFSRPDLAGVLAQYERGIAQADAEVGRLLDWQAKRGRLERTIVILTSDHGEELGEHGGVGHGRTLYQEVMRVPLVFRIPGIQSRRVHVAASVADIAPTVRQLMGLPRRPRVDGRSLVTCIKGGSCPKRPIYAEVVFSAHRFAVIHEGFKLIQSFPRVQRLFDLDQDPQEQHNLADLQPSRRDAMEMLLNRCRQGACEPVR